MSDKPATPPHNRKLGLIGTALTKARNPKGDVQALSAVRDEIEQVLIDTDFCVDAPFSWVTIAIRFGLKKEDVPHYQGVNKKYGDLPLAIEVPVEEMLVASLPELKNIFKEAALKALIHAGEKYKLPISKLREMTTI